MESSDPTRPSHFRSAAIEVESAVGLAHPAVKRIFTEGLPEGMKGAVVAELDTRGYEEVVEGGEKVRPFAEVPKWVPCVRVWVDLV